MVLYIALRPWHAWHAHIYSVAPTTQPASLGTIARHCLASSPTILVVQAPFLTFIDLHRFALRVDGVISCALCDACTRRVRDPKSKAVPLAASCPSPPFLTVLFSFSLENESCRCVTTDPRHLVKIPRSNSPSAHFPYAGVNADGQMPRCQLAWFTEVRYVL